MTAPLLSIRGVKTYYGHIAALRGIDLDVEEGEIVALIGANGAGKSTLIEILSGAYPPTSGEIIWRGSDRHGRTDGLFGHRGTRVRL